MKSTTLHITSGDSVTQVLQKLNIGKEAITWREMLCEGRTTTEVGSENFWKTRFDYLRDSYKITKKTFIDFTLKEYRNLCNYKNQDEIILWFEYDLSSQINMVAVVSWLKRYRKGRKVSIVQSGIAGKSKKMKKFTELTDKQFLSLHKKRVELTQDDIEYADYIWQLYCSDSPLRLELVHKFNPMSPFLYLEDALKAHLQRFPSTNNGLNNVENFILKTADNKELKTDKEFINSLVEKQKSLGFTGLQYENKIDSLKKLFVSFNPVELSKKGKQVLDNQLNFYPHIRNDFSYLGGTKKYSFLYVNANDKLLKIA